MLVTGPQLVAVLPNSGDVLQDGDILHTSPQQLTFVFNEGQIINANSLDGIKITRSGGDDAFTAAETTSDLGTDGAVVLHFQATAGGVSGNGTVIQFSRRDFGGVGGPLISVDAKTVSVELNSNALSPTTAADVVTALNGNLASSRLVTATLVSGLAATPLGTLPSIPTVELEGANTARASTDMQTGGDVAIEFLAKATGAAGNGIQIEFDHADLGTTTTPAVTVAGDTIRILLNTRSGNESTAGSVVLAVNNNPAASQLVSASLNAGPTDTDVATPSVGIAPLVLSGGNDVEILPGFIQVDPESPNAVVIRFAETLPDDLYSLDILGLGSEVLTNTLGEPFDCATDFRLEFEVDRGAEVIAVVPQPVTRDESGRLSQAANVIDVYFNDDDLNLDDNSQPKVTNPSFYQLIKTQDTVHNTDDEVYVPTSVEYDPATDTARLTFGSDPTTLPGGPGTYRLRIGTDEALPTAPTEITLDASVVEDLGTGGDVEIRFSALRDFGTAVTVSIEAEDFGDAGAPLVSVAGMHIRVTLNSNAGNESTAADLVDAFNGDPFAAQFATAEIENGDDTTNVALPVAAQPAAFSIAGVGSSFATASDLGTLSTQSQIISSAIDAQEFLLDLPGAVTEIGHRFLPFEQHLLDGKDSTEGITTISYNFRDEYGTDPIGNVLHNVITDTQKQRAREIFDLYSSLLGVQFIEVDESQLLDVINEGLTTFTIVTGDLRAVSPSVTTGPGGVLGIAGSVRDPILGTVPTAVMDNAEEWDDAYGAQDQGLRLSWFETAMHEIGHLLGLGHTYDLPPGAVMGSTNQFNPGVFSGEAEAIYPGDAEIIHGRHLYRPESKDIDLYRFELDEPGRLSAEIIAERQASSSLLDSALTLYRQQLDGTLEVIARNDDYFSEDAYLDLNLETGTYFIAVTASGNQQFDPHIEDSGFGGTSQGPYDLRLNFRPETDRSIVDTTGVPLDGDGDGTPGGVHNFWFRAQTVDHTFIVDKSAAAGGVGSLAAPFRTISSALAAAGEGDIVRIVGNGGADGDVATLGDNLAYEVGFDSLNQGLADGTTMEVPRGVTVMVDAGSVFKLRRARVGVGSSAPGIDRSGGALQVLGTPETSVYFTSLNDESIGVDHNPLTTVPRAGDWGGISFRSDVDREEGRFIYESVGVFLNYVNHADLRFGGGDIVVNSIEQVVTPIQMVETRPTITFNTITNSADAALSADPNSFEETNFHAVDSLGVDYQATAFTSDYDRIGPELHGNLLLDNTINGLFIRISTPAGGDLRRLTVSGRWDDTDVVHVITENLVVQSDAGGAYLASGDAAVTELTARTDARLAIDPGTIVKLDGARIETTLGAQLIAEGSAAQQVTFTSLRDNRFGAGGTFSTNMRDTANPPTPGDWGGLYIAPSATASIDKAHFSYAGGVTKIEGSFSGFNTIEIHQANVRIANSRFERNADGVGGQQPSDQFARAGRGTNDGAVIFVRGAQPVIINNVFVDNEVRADDNGGTSVPVININVNSLNHEYVTDLGRSTGFVDALGFKLDNQGPLIRGNRMDGGTGSIHGMVVRGGVLTTEIVWDDTDITHVVRDEITITDFHTYGGLRLESGVDESLVVKLQGVDAGFTVVGRPHEITDRSGGRIQIIGQPGFPVVLTSLADDTVGAGATPDGTPQTDTNSDRNATSPQPGDWRSVLLEEYSHDRNVEIINESEKANAPAPGPNATPSTAQVLGTLAPSEKSGDENRRLGFEVHGFLTGPDDVDVYSFVGTAGTEIRLDIDRSSHWVDTVLELVDANGTVVAASDNSVTDDDPLLGLKGTAFPLEKSDFTADDSWTSNPRDAGLRVVLPGARGHEHVPCAGADEPAGCRRRPE